MNDKNIISAFIKDMKESMFEAKLTKDDVCFILYADHKPHSIFKTIEDFENKVESVVNKIDEMHRIDFQMWIFD